MHLRQLLLPIFVAEIPFLGFFDCIEVAISFTSDLECFTEGALSQLRNNLKICQKSIGLLQLNRGDLHLAIRLILTFISAVFLCFLCEVQDVGERGVYLIGSEGFQLLGGGVGHEPLGLLGAHQLGRKSVLGDGQVHVL